MTIDELLTKYRDENISERNKGAKFERLMKNFLLTYPEYRGQFAKVYLWNEFSDEPDLGIDIVVETTGGDLWAVQCKCYSESSIIDKPAVDTFLANSSRTFKDKNFSARLWISTSDNLTDNADKTLQNQSPPVTRIGLEELRKAAVDWQKLDAGIFGRQAVHYYREPLPHQLNAINAAQNYFRNHERGKLIMACGTGKTFTSLRIAERIFPTGKILFLVPSISLLSQILHEWATFADKHFNYICVCSDKTVSSKDDDEILSVNLPLPATTDEKIIARRLKSFSGETMTVVFSTYQSLDKVAAAQIDFDLIICDEAHRTTGSSKDSSTQFTFVHSNENIRGKKRLYMTATPRLYTSEAKIKAAVNDITVWSMDDENIYGDEFYRLNFGEAVEKNLLTDYKVAVLAVNEDTSDEKSADDLVKIIGCINALSKKTISISKELAKVDPAPMHTAVAFCSKIADSKKISKAFNALADNFKNLLAVESRHVDGTQKSSERDKNLHWLKDTPTDGNACRILTNARCLSEGVDVPSLDAVIFTASKKSKVEIVQAVGRVMRKAPDKKYGYIIIPVVVPLDKNPEDVLEKSKAYGVIWEILNALRAHDRRIDIFIEEIKFNKTSDHISVVTVPKIGEDGGADDGDNPGPIPLDFGEEWRDYLYARMVEHVGNRRYWEQWAKDIAEIANRHIEHIKNLIAVEGNHRRAFYNFLDDLQKNLNPAITPAQAVEMLAHHLISRPVFDAIFDDYSFVKNNPVSLSLENILSVLDTQNTDDDAQLEKFYNSVRERCAIAKTAEQKQKIIIELYDKFFKMAVPKTVERLGIVYTPVEVVDFILRSVDAVLKKNFNRNLSGKNVHVLDPFTGTGTFITRLIQSGLIRQRDLFRKYFVEFHANEIVLLAYYIAAVNIENAFHDAFDAKSYQPFEGICFTDTFQLYERGEIPLNLEGVMKKNSERVNEQRNSRIEIIVGNPPYSVGQRSANDNNQNETYANLETRIAATYAARTDATNKNSLYDSYIKAFRWASDRIAEGVIGFVTNAGWIDGAAMDGLRKSFADEFAEIYIFNLRGNARTQGEIRRREKDNVFGQGTRTPIAITILVKREHTGAAKIFYKDIGDYLTREEKLFIIKNTPSVLSDEFKLITPNERGDWINQRGDTFDSFIPLAPDKKFNGAAQSFFIVNSRGIVTDRDAWCYNFSRSELEKNIRTTIDFYNSHEPTYFDPTKITWTRATKNNRLRGREYIFNVAQIVEANYRPFCKTNFYYDKYLNEMTYQVPKIFPTGREENLLICVTGVGSSKNFSTFIVNKIPCLDMIEKSQCFPLYYYEAARQGSLFGDNMERRDGVSDWIMRNARKRYGANVSKEDIFYYVYGFLHLPSYREKFSAELKKSLPRIILSDKFWEISRAGRELAALHLNYESQPPAQVEVIGADKNNFAVKKMRLSNDKTTLTYNDFITIRNIPPRSFDYVVNGRSPLEWLIDRYQIKTDAASGIVNDPNAWAIEHGNPRYILNLILSCITVSLKTLEIVEGLPEVEYEID